MVLTASEELVRICIVRVCGKEMQLVHLPDAFPCTAAGFRREWVLDALVAPQLGVFRDAQL